jgi:hypothetical protein
VRRRALLGLSLPLAAAGSLAGHAAGYALAGMSRQDARAHAYLAFAPEFLGLCVALIALALALRVSGRLQGHPATWPFALLPALAFCAQEIAERLLAGLPAHAVFEPPVYAGLAAQVPTAVLAYLVARALLRVADEAALVLRPRRLLTIRPRPLPVPPAALWLACAPLAFDRLGRAPPRR